MLQTLSGRHHQVENRIVTLNDKRHYKLIVIFFFKSKTMLTLM